MENDILTYILTVGVPVFATIVGFAIKTIVETKAKTKFINSIKVGDILCELNDLANPFQTKIKQCRKICEIRQGDDDLLWFDYIVCDKEGHSTYQTHWQMNENNYFFEDCVKLDN